MRLKKNLLLLGIMAYCSCMGSNVKLPVDYVNPLIGNH